MRASGDRPARHRHSLAPTDGGGEWDFRSGSMAPKEH
jgi:hypothetical protein